MEDNLYDSSEIASASAEGLRVGHCDITERGTGAAWLRPAAPVNLRVSWESGKKAVAVEQFLSIRWDRGRRTGRAVCHEVGLSAPC